MEYVLEVNDLEKRYKNMSVLDNLNVHIKQGSIYGLIGKNGAGKTTLIRIICGLQKPTNGNYIIYGIPNNSKEITNVRKRISAIVENPAIYNDMSAKQNLIEQFKLDGIPSYEDIDELLKLVGLENVERKKVKHFSLGMKQRLGIAISLANNPDFLILDEPINGLDPQGIIEIRELILKLNKENGITILISSHYLDELSKIATHYGFLHNGHIIEEISSESLMKKLNHKIELKVSNIKSFARYLETNHIAYDISQNDTLYVYNINLTKLVSELSKENLIAEEIHEQDESLESYYMNLIGGASND